MRGIFVGAYTAPEARQAWTKVLGLMTETGAKPIVDSIFPMARLMDAFERLKQGPMGKVLVEIR
jgi:NADPH2:quinone reductase